MTLSSYFSWNGLSLGLRGQWEVVRLQEKRIVVTNHDHDVFDFIWTESAPIKSSSTPLPRILKKISNSGGIILSRSRPLDDLPFPDFLLLDSIEWEKQKQTTTAAVLQCKFCGRIVLIQFSSPYPEKTLFSNLHALFKLMDHHASEAIRWQVYGVQLALPFEFALKNYRFFPGFFELQFQCKQLQLVCYRWAAAGSLLHNRNLSDFAHSFFTLPNKAVWQTTDPSTHEMVAFNASALNGSSGFYSRIQRKFKTPFCLRIRHNPGTDKIMAMQMAGDPSHIFFLNCHTLISNLWTTYECR